jgi:AGZA family xanthine/uracil permease-like MFS transporter
MAIWMENANRAVARSFVGKYFRLEGSGHVCIVQEHYWTISLRCSQPKERKGSKFFTEFRAGLATFFAMAYIISVNCTSFPKCSRELPLIFSSRHCFRLWW